MAGAMEKLQTLNSLIRTVLALVVVGGVGTVSWFGYQTYTDTDQQLENTQQALLNKEAELADTTTKLVASQQQIFEHEATIADQNVAIETLNEEVRKKAAEIQRLDTALRLHKMERRLALVTILDTQKDPASGKTSCKIQFVELDDAGGPMGKAEVFDLEGDVVYIDYLVVKFDDEYVEQADLERGMSICLFNRIFGEFQTPKDGYSLDKPGTRPGLYARGSVMSDFEKKIWEDFWSIANNPQQAAEMGIRAAHGDAVWVKVEKDKKYRVTVRASGSPEIEVVNDATPNATAG